MEDSTVSAIMEDKEVAKKVIMLIGTKYFFKEVTKKERSKIKGLELINNNVGIAIMEIIEECKEYLEEEGIDIEDIL